MCDAIGNPFPQIYWMKDTKPILNGNYNKLYNIQMHIPYICEIF